MSVIDEYFEKLEPKQRAELERIRRIVRKSYPDAEETISYGMPAFRYKGKYFVGFNAFKNHLSLFPGGRVIGELQYKLGAFKLSKGTIRFEPSHPIPEELIKEILDARAEDILQP